MSRQGEGVLIMAGGTGGHIFPGLAVAAALRARSVPVRWLGAAGGMEVEKVPAEGIELDLVEISGLRGKGALRWLRMPLMLLKAVWHARRLLERNRPGCAVSFGGYAAGPGGIAAWTKGIPLLVHEQNRVPGLTNRVLARFAKTVLQGFPGSFSATLETLDCGNPVRRAVAELPEPHLRMAQRDGPLRLLVTGGSQGAQVLNQLVPAALALLSKNPEVEIRHQAGKGHADETRAAYAAAGIEAAVSPFIDDMAAAYAWADLVVSRSGALTVAELAAAGLGSVLVPYAHAVDDHQTRNAEYLAAGDAAVVFPQASLDAATMARTLGALLSDRAKLLDMACAARRLALPDAAECVADACNEWLGQ